MSTKDRNFDKLNSWEAPFDTFIIHKDSSKQHIIKFIRNI